MRSAVLVLLLLNLAFFAWAHWISGPDREAADAGAGSSPPRLRLASEPAPSVKTAPAVITGEAPMSGTKCISLGPFADDATAAKAAALLTQAGHQPRSRSVELVSGRSWWVSAEVPSEKEAQPWLKLLQAKGIKDVRLVPPDATAAGTGTTALIDLGVFDDQAQARQHAADVAAYGLKPQVNERPIVLKAQWIDLDLVPGAAAVDATAIAPAVGVSLLELQACPPVVAGADESPAPRPQTG
jgi:hypothetical protein